MSEKHQNIFRFLPTFPKIQKWQICEPIRIPLRIPFRTPLRNTLANTFPNSTFQGGTRAACHRGGDSARRFRAFGKVFIKVLAQVFMQVFARWPCLYISIFIHWIWTWGEAVHIMSTNRASVRPQRLLWWWLVIVVRARNYNYIYSCCGAH